MGQSVTIACSPNWDLASLGALIAVAARDAGAKFVDLGHQVEVIAIVTIDGLVAHGGWLLVAYEFADRKFAIEDYETNELLDERFRLEVPALKFLELSFHDVDLTRAVLRAFCRAAVSRGETGWIDTDYGWVVHVRDFLEKTNDDPRWDWRRELSQDC